MWKIVLQWFVVFMLYVINVQAQSFEGTFEMRIMDDGSISRMLFYVKGDKIVIEPIDETLPRPVRILMQKGVNYMYILTEEQGTKVAIKNTFQLPPDIDSMVSKKAYNVIETEEKKMIGAYECRKVIVDNSDGQKLEMWVTSKMGFTLAQFFDCIGKFSATISNGDYREVTKNNHQELFQKNMALEINELKEGSSTKITITNIIKKALSEADFDLTTYTVVDMESMMGK